MARNFIPISITGGAVIGFVLLEALDALLFHGFFKTGFVFAGAVAGGVAGFYIGAFLGDLQEGDDA